MHAEAIRSLGRMRCARAARNSAHWAAGLPSLSADDNQFHSLLLSSAVRLIWHISRILGKQVQADDLLTDNASRIIGAFHTSIQNCRNIVDGVRRSSHFAEPITSTFSISLGTRWFLSHIGPWQRRHNHVPARSNKQNWVAFAQIVGLTVFLILVCYKIRVDILKIIQHHILHLFRIKIKT